MDRGYHEHGRLWQRLGPAGSRELTDIDAWLRQRRRSLCARVKPALVASERVASFALELAADFSVVSARCMSRIFAHPMRIAATVLGFNALKFML